MDPAIFFPERGANAGPAKAICAACPVNVECGAAGLMDDFGVWGGMAQRDRQARRVALGATSGHIHGRPTGCGTRNGLWEHRKAGEPPCEECLATRRADDRARRARLRARRAAA